MPVIQQNEEEGRECRQTPYVWVGKGVILMQSEDVWDVAGVSFVDKLFCAGTEPVYRI